ncbi:AT hook domain-containing protein [Colletotrichum acutatum]
MEGTRRPAVSTRRTRQTARLDEAAVASSGPSQTTNNDPHSVIIEPEYSSTGMMVEGLHILPEVLHVGLKLKHLRKKSIQLLLKKRQLLVETPLDVPEDMEKKGLASSVMATLVFAQEEAGTAVCISPKGILLTCSHCIAETIDDFDGSKSHWLLFASGQVVEARALAWDGRRDLALLKVTSAQQPPPPSGPTSSPPHPGGFPFVTVSSVPPASKTRIICVGHPGSEDFEAAVPGTKTDYDVLHLSTGTFRGCAEGQDPQDNSDIGALMHSCWTYWGHSGAPLVDRKTGTLVGLHSSWDDETGMRRGVAQKPWFQRIHCTLPLSALPVQTFNTTSQHRLRAHDTHDTHDFKVEPQVPPTFHFSNYRLPVCLPPSAPTMPNLWLGEGPYFPSINTPTTTTISTPTRLLSQSTISLATAAMPTTTEEVEALRAWVLSTSGNWLLNIAKALALSIPLGILISAMCCCWIPCLWYTDHLTDDFLDISVWTGRLLRGEYGPPGGWITFIRRRVRMFFMGREERAEAERREAQEAIDRVVGELRGRDGHVVRVGYQQEPAMTTGLPPQNRNMRRQMARQQARADRTSNNDN